MTSWIKYSFLGVIVALFFYSFTQVDLSLTLSQASFLQTIQRSFQQIGYFNRPLSTIVFVIILALLFAYYIYFLRLALERRITKKDVFLISTLTALILSFSYNAFSYDLFNYIFDAKIITHYHENPYIHKALDYPGDPMLSFMRWTHRVYPYGPIWLALTVPISFIGMNIFLVTFFLFKFLISAFYLGSVYMIYKISQKIDSENSIFHTVLFALNPLVVIESLVSSHNDIVMVFFALLGVFLIVGKKKILGLISIIVSSQVKIPTLGLLLPAILSFPAFRLKLNDNKTIGLMVLSMLGVLAYVLLQIEIQPWYFLWIIPFAVLLKPNKYITAAIFGVSLGLLSRYLVLLYFGNWDGVGVPIRNGLTIAIPLITLALVFVMDKLKLLKRD
jgi:hypothetical protein